MYSIMSAMASSGGERVFKIGVWVVVAILVSGVVFRLGGSAYNLATGSGKIAQRLGSGTPVTVGMDTFKSNASPDDRPIYIRADVSGPGRCTTTDPEVTLSERAGSELTVDGTSWRQVYVMQARKGGDHSITCRARKGAEFAVGRDEYWDGPLYFGLAILGLIVVAVGFDSLRRKLSPAYAAKEDERAAEWRARNGRLEATLKEVEAQQQRAAEAPEQEDHGPFLEKPPRISLRKAKALLKPQPGTMHDVAQPPCPACGTPAKSVVSMPGRIGLVPCAHMFRVRRLTDARLRALNPGSRAVPPR